MSDKTKKTPEQIQYEKFQELLKKSNENRAIIYDADKAKFYRNLQNFYNQNYFGYGVHGKWTRHNPTTPQGQAKIRSDMQYAKSNVRNFSDNLALTGLTGAINSLGLRIYNKFFKSPFKKPTKTGNLGSYEKYTGEVIGEGAEAVVVPNTYNTVAKITNIPVEEMTLRNSIPGVAPSKYIGFVKRNGRKLPTYVQEKVKTLDEKTFSTYQKAFDKLMEKAGFKRVNDPQVQYRAYTNGEIVIDDIGPHNTGLTKFKIPKIIDLSYQTVQDWLAQGFVLKNGGKFNAWKK